MPPPIPCNLKDCVLIRNEYNSGRIEQRRSYGINEQRQRDITRSPSHPSLFTPLPFMCLFLFLLRFLSVFVSFSLFPFGVLPYFL